MHTLIIIIIIITIPKCMLEPRHIMINILSLNHISLEEIQVQKKFTIHHQLYPIIFLHKALKNSARIIINKYFKISTLS